MIQQVKIIYTTLAGVCSAIITWLISELLLRLPEILVQPRSEYDWNRGYAYILYLFIFSVVLGSSLGLVDVMSQDSEAKQRKSFLMHALGGGLAGILIPLVWFAIYRIYVSQPSLAYRDAALTQPEYSVSISFLVLGWAGICGFITSIPNIMPRLYKQMSATYAGGFISGILGGYLFQSFIETYDQSAEEGALYRLGSLIVIGFFVGFIPVLLNELTKNTWLILYNPGNMRREYLIGTRLFKIGIDTSCDIVLEKEGAIAPVHVTIEPIVNTKHFRLRHTARNIAGRSYAKTIVNGVDVTSEKWISSGDKIKIGRYLIEFYDKFSASDSIAPVQKLQSTSDIVPNRFNDLAFTRTQMIHQGENDAKPQEDNAEHCQAVTTIDQATAEQDEPDKYPETVVATGTIGTRLACVEGPYLGQAFPLTHEDTYIGRHQQHAINIPADTSVSRTHAMISYQNGRHYISDAGSSNGILVNNIRITDPRLLNKGDLIKVGDTSLRYE